MANIYNAYVYQGGLGTLVALRPGKYYNELCVGAQVYVACYRHD